VRFRTNERRRGSKVGDILVGTPKLPQGSRLRAPAPRFGRNEGIGLANARAPTRLLVLSFDQITIMMKDICDFQPVCLDPAKLGWNGQPGVFWGT
jgi:hypothetical protein